MALSGGAGPLLLAVPFGIAIAIPFRALAVAVAAAHPWHITGVAPILRGEGHAAGVAQDMVSGLELVVDGGPLVEHKALAPPEAPLRWRGLEVAQDAPPQMVHVRVSGIEEKGGGFFAADATGAEEGEVLGLPFGH
jgi:hypothetical protein